MSKKLATTTWKGSVFMFWSIFQFSSRRLVASILSISSQFSTQITIPLTVLFTLIKLDFIIQIWIMKEMRTCRKLSKVGFRLRASLDTIKFIEIWNKSKNHFFLCPSIYILCNTSGSVYRKSSDPNPVFVWTPRCKIPLKSKWQTNNTTNLMIFQHF